MTTADKTRSTSPTRLGEELPVFCERCGYSLHGLAQIRCQQCDILHFVCPECGHRQPINTLRPAAQRILGRLRAAALAFVVVVKLNFFGWLLLGWIGMGASWSLRYTGSSGGVPILAPRPVDIDALLAFMIFALPFGLIGRLLLLRWRRGALVGLVLAGLVIASIAFGAEMDRLSTFGGVGKVASPWTADFSMLVLGTGALVVIASVIAWPIWVVLVRALLPAKTASVLLDWQRSQSNRTASTLARG